jgi:Bacterial conjugation TrbI-like protein
MKCTPLVHKVAPLVLGFALAPFITLAQSDDMKVVPRTSERVFPDDSALEADSATQKKMQAIQKEADELRSKLAAGQPAPVQDETPSTQGTSALVRMPGDQGADAVPSATPAVAVPVREAPASPVRKTVRASYGNSLGHEPVRGSPVQVFGVTASRAKGPAAGLTVLPTGSHVKARIVSGVEANAREPYPVLLQLDYAFTGPNKSIIDLSNCFMIAKAKANLSTERVMMETDRLSCVREDGEHFKREAKGYVAGDDNTFGATGTYISKQGQVLLAAVLASIAKNAGQAIADAQKTTSVLGADKAAAATNITGSKAAYIGGSAMVDGATIVAQWYLEQAKDLIPSIGVGSGQDVFVIMLDTIEVPALLDEEN